MFDGQRYVTARVNSSIAPNVQLFIWNLIEDLKGKIKLDYLQVFELTKLLLLGRFVQRIVHSQEIPYHRQVYIINTFNPVDAKVYVISEGLHTTMLLAEEY